MPTLDELLEEERKKRKKPSQIAADQNKGGGSGGSALDSLLIKARNKEPIVSASAAPKSNPKPKQQEPPKKNLFQQGVDKVKDFFAPAQPPTSKKPPVQIKKLNVPDSVNNTNIPLNGAMATVKNMFDTPQVTSGMLSTNAQGLQQQAKPLTMDELSEKLRKIPTVKGIARFTTTMMGGVSDIADFATDFAINNPEIATGGRISGKAADLLRTEGKKKQQAGTLGSQRFKNYVDALQNSDYLAPTKQWQDSSIKDKFSKKHIGETFAVTVPSVLGSIVPFIVNMPLGTLMAFAPVANDIKDGAIEAGMDEGKAEALGIGTGVFISILERVVPSKTLGKQKQAFIQGMIKRVVHTGKMSALESGTEIAQEAAQMLIEDTFITDLSWDVRKTRLVLAGFGGALGGGAMGVLNIAMNEAVINRMRPEPPTNNREKEKEKENRIGGMIFSPEELRNHIQATDIAGTPLANEIAVIVDQADDKGKGVRIIVNPSEGSIFKATTPNGTKLGYELIDKPKIELLEVDGEPVTEENNPFPVPTEDNTTVTQPSNVVQEADSSVTPKVTTFESNIQEYRSFGGVTVGTSTENAALRDIAAVANDPEVRAFTQQRVAEAIDNNTLPVNDDGTITVFRGGEPSSRNALTSVTFDRTVAEQFAEENNGTVTELRIKQEEIRAFIGRAESEILIANPKREQKLSLKPKAEPSVVDYSAIKDKTGISVEEYVNKKLGKFRTPLSSEPSVLQRDAYRQAIENQAGIVDVIKRSEINQGFLDNGDADISLYDDAVRLHRLLYGSRKRPPDTIEKIVAELKDGLRAAKSSAAKGIFDTPKFRLKDDLAKKGIEITDAQEAEIIALNKKIFGDENVQIIGQILANNKALGEYKAGIIKILAGQADATDTYYHEVVHKYLDVFTDKQEYMDILIEGDKKYKLNDFAAVEEKIAEDFIKYAKNKTGITGQLKLQFDKVLLRIQKYLDNSSKIDELYNDILTKKKTQVAQSSTPTLYRGEGGNNKFSGVTSWTKGRNYATDPERAKAFGNVSEYRLKPDAKVLKIDARGKSLEQIAKELDVSTSDIVLPSRMMEILKSRGYDAIDETTRIVDDAGKISDKSKTVRDFIILNDDAVQPRVAQPSTKPAEKKPEIKTPQPKHPERVPTEEKAKRPAYTSKTALTTQKDFNDRLRKIAREAKTQNDLVAKARVEIDSRIKELEGDRDALAGVRTSINKEMYGFIGTNGSYKLDYALLQTEKDNPEIGKYLTLLEDKITQIDGILKHKDPVYTGGSANAAQGVFSDLENKSYFRSAEFPEVLRLYQTLSGKTPLVVGERAMRNAYGRAYSKDLRVKLSTEIFKDPNQAIKTFAHELGHIIDYLPDRTGKRGNVVGRVATLHKNLKDLYGDLSNKEIKAELMAVSKEWRPFDAKRSAPSYVKYRNSAPELYADAISVLFNDPVRLMESAPKFYKGFFEYLDRKPAVKENLFKLHDLLNKNEEAIFNARNEAISKAYLKAEAVWAAKNLENQNRRINIYEALRTMFDDRNYKLNAQVKQEIRQGSNISASTNPAFAFEGLNYLDGKMKNFVGDNFQPAYIKAGEVANGWEQLGKVLQMERAINERGDLANPMGFDPKTAKDFLAGLQRDMPAEDWAKIQEAKILFRDGMDEVVAIAEENGYYKPEMIAEMKANPSYATFQVIEYLDTYISPSIKQQVGTLKEVANPATASVMKAIATMKAIEVNNAKKMGVDFELEHRPAEIEKAKTTFNGRSQIIIDSRDPLMGTVRIIRDGKAEGYYMEKGLAEVFNNTSSHTLRQAAHISRLLTGSQIYRPLFTGINLGFQTFNFVRDFMRYWKNTPDYTFGAAVTSLPRAMLRYGQAAPHAFREVTGKPDDLIKEMENQKILGLTYNDMFVNPDLKEQKQIERVMQRAGVMDSTRHRIITLPFVKTLQGLELFGNFIERLPKIAGYIELKGKMPEEELAFFLRNFIGSPNFRKGGTLTPVTNNIFMFSNAIKEGLKTDAQIATTYRTSDGKRTRAGFWWKTVIGAFVPKAIMIAAAAGLYGEWEKDRMDDVSEYDKTNYTIVPLGVDENGKTVILRVPMDETSRFLSGLMWKIANTTMSGKADFKDFAQLVDFGAGQIPNVIPSITGGGALLTYLSGRNPYDDFRGRNVIPDKEFEAGVEYSFPIFMEWFLQSQGLGIIIPTFKPEGDLSALQRITGLPVLSNILGRWIKTTDYGQTEQNRELIEPIGREKAIKSLEERKVLEDAVKKYNQGSRSVASRLQLERSLVKQVYGNPPYTKDEKLKRTLLEKKFRIAVQRQEVDPDINSVISAPTVDEKVILLVEMGKDRDSKEMTKILKELKKQKIISQNVISEYNKKRRQQR